MFAPSGFPVPKNLDGDPDEGWVVTSEGNTRYLRSFFGKDGNRDAISLPRTET